MYIFDDATSGLSKNRYSEALTNVFTTSRHGKGITVFLITHALANVIAPQNRVNIDHLFIGKFMNSYVIEKQVFKELLGFIYPNLDTFMKDYTEKIFKNEHQFLYLTNQASGKVDINVKAWQLVNRNYKEKVKPNTNNKNNNMK